MSLIINLKKSTVTKEQITAVILMVNTPHRTSTDIAIATCHVASVL